MPNLKLLLSVVFFFVGAYAGYELARIGLILENPRPTALLSGYKAWALYWGVPVAFRWWRGISSKFRVRSLFGLLMKFSFYLFVPWWGGLFYGFFGGGIYQTVRHVRLARL